MYIEVDTPMMRNHARELRAIEGNIKATADAVETTIDPLAFGVINAPLAVGTTALLTVFKRVVAFKATDIGTTAEGVLAMADTHDTKDDDAKTGIAKAAH